MYKKYVVNNDKGQVLVVTNTDGDIFIEVIDNTLLSLFQRVKIAFNLIFKKDRKSLFFIEKDQLEDVLRGDEDD